MPSNGFLSLGSRGLLLLACAVPAARAQDADPVKQLKTELQSGYQDEKAPAKLQFRMAALEQRVKALQTPGELGRALLLREWRTESIHREMAEVDGAVRAVVVTRFRKAIDAGLDDNDASRQQATAALVSELALAARTVRSRS